MIACAPPIVRRIAAGIRNARARGYEPNRLYLVDEDARALEAAAPDEWARRSIGGLVIRHSRSVKSKIYCRSGASVHVPKKPPP